ncbi:hypothetical protein L1887_21101 [Cichorium endivia]|nr:hypothetical protein L1887_21101 [Cichorium endivia]
MAYFPISLPVLASCLLLYIHYAQARLHHHPPRYHHHEKKHKHAADSPPGSHISQPPYYSPSPSPLLAPSPSPSSPYSSLDGIFDVREFGAVGDGMSDDTNAFKDAWDSACQTDSAVLLVPHGHSFMIQSNIFTGPCQSGLIFQVDGTLMPPDGPESWPKNNSRRQWLVFYRIDEMTFQGTGLIDGRGERWWNLPCKPHKVGDDCVSIGSGCYDVDIKNITCGQGHGISIGSLGNHNSRASVSNITVRDSAIKQSANGVRIKTWQGGYGSVSGVRYENIRMENVRNPIIVDQFYCLTKECLNQTSAVVVSDIEYRNIKGTYNVRSPPMHFGCSDSVPCRNITLSEVELLPAEGEMVLDAFCWNVYGELETMTIPPVSCLLDGTP